MLNSTDWDERLGGENGFDIVRLLFATLVVFEHSYFLPFNSITPEPLFIFSGGQTDFGSLAVNGFFAISGFLITHSCLTTNNAPRYFKKRVSRIVPGFLLASLLTLFVFGPLGADDARAFFHNMNIRATLVRVLSLHSSGVGNTLQHNPMKSIVDGTLWTIKYEFDCYVLVAVLWRLGLLKRGPILVMLIVLVLSFGLQKASVISPPTVDHGVLAVFISSPNNWPRLFSYFFAGSAFYLWRDVIPKSTLWLAVSIVILALGIRFKGAEVVMLTAGIYCLFFVPLSAGRSLRLLDAKIDLSYGIYLFGFPIQQLIIATRQSITPEMLFFLSLPLTCAIAYLSWTLVESPSLRWARGMRLVQSKG